MRRGAERVPEAKILHSELQIAHNRIIWAVRRWNQAIDEHGSTLAGVIYHGQPPIYPYLETVRQLPSLLERNHTLNLKRGVVREADQQLLVALDQHDVYNLPVNGVSLADIATMELPNGSLSTRDLSRASRMFYTTVTDLALGWILKESHDHRWIRNWATALATKGVLDQWGEGQEVCPKGLRPLRDRLVSFFDYPTRLIIDFTTEDEEDIWLFQMLRLRATNLIPALSCFIPARLGIMPQTAIKLFRQRADKSIIPTISWSKVGQGLERQMNKAYLPGALPKDLEHFQEFDAENDQAAASLLRTNCRDRYSEYVRRTESNGFPNILTERLSRYHPALVEDIRRSRDQRVVVDLPDKQALSRVTITCQNELALVFLLHFRETAVQLPLEISWNQLDEGGRLYGLPAQVTREYPHAGSFLLEDILPSVLEMAKNRHPQIEPPPLPKIVHPTPQEDLYPVAPSEGKKPKEKSIASWVKQKLSVISQPEPPEPRPVPRPVCRVNYQPEDIARFLGERVTSERVARVLRVIERFEHGRKLPDKALRSDRLRLELWAGRDIRIVLEPIASGTFDLFQVGWRREMFKPRRQRLLG